ncbi:MAG: dihydroneopterin aldolase [Kiloniellales bacterium]
MIQDLCLMVRLGVGVEERAQPQRLMISLEVAVQPAPPRDDDVTSVVDYGALVTGIQRLASRETQLLETWAQWIAEICLEDSRIASATITLIKPDIFDGSVQVGIRQTIAR